MKTRHLNHLRVLKRSQTIAQTLLVLGLVLLIFLTINAGLG